MSCVTCESYRSTRRKNRIQQEYENRLKDTFRSVAKSYFNGIYKEKAKNPETREKNWERLKNHIFPYIGDKHVSEIKVKELASIYEKIADRSNTLKKYISLSVQLWIIH
ncbi:hypothetical protein [Haemophilus sp. SZY H36]|uniref:phage integrase central domain-containing protein n=1 Tax=Haemophilus sp. SZY H36 TaxID=2839968 RepID=UPI001C044B91